MHLPLARQSENTTILGSMLRLLTYLLILLSLALAQNTVVGRASVVDGDTLEIQGVRIRLWGVDVISITSTLMVAVRIRLWV